MVSIPRNCGCTRPCGTQMIGSSDPFSSPIMRNSNRPAPGTSWAGINTKACSLMRLSEYGGDDSWIDSLDTWRLPMRLAVLIHHHGPYTFGEVRVPHRGTGQC